MDYMFKSVATTVYVHCDNLVKHPGFQKYCEWCWPNSQWKTTHHRL